MRTLFTSLFLASALNVTAQIPPFDWVRGFPQSVAVYAAATAPSGDVYFCGNFIGTVDLDPTSGVSAATGNGQSDAFVVKMTAAGGFLWARSWGGSSSDFANALVVDASGAVVVVGEFNGTVDFDPGAGTTNLTSAGIYDGFAVKLDASGNLSWAQRWGSAQSEYSTGVALDAAGSAYVCGLGYGAAGAILTTKLTSTGAISWERGWATDGGFDRGNAVAVDAAGAVYIASTFNGTNDFNPGSGVANLVSAGNFDCAISKLDSAGNFIWAKRFGGTLDDRATDMRITAGGQICATGMFSGTADFDPGTATLNLTAPGTGYNLFVARFDTAGAVVSAASVGGTGVEENPNIAIDAAGAVFLSARFTDTTDLDPGAGVTSFVSNGGADALLLKLDAANALVWGARIGGAGSDNPLALEVNADALYFGSGLPGTVDVDPGAGVVNFTSSGHTVVKLALNGMPSGVADADVLEDAVLAPNPADDWVTMKFSNEVRDAVVRLVGMNGAVVREWRGVSGASLRIDLRGVVPGVYVAETQTGRVVTRVRLVKK